MLFHEVDADSSGGISQPEALVFWQNKVKSMDPEELKKRLDQYKAKTLEEAIERGFKLVDKNSDNQVNPEELKIYLTSD
jgi:Ca2+-binding EF-hand superfamily protein